MNRRSLIGSLTGSLMGGLATTLMGSILATRPGTARAQPDGELDVPYVTTPQNVVDAMLELAEVGPNDRLLDLGSGDGRIVITAARRFGTVGLGIEIDPTLVELSRRNASRQGVAQQARFIVADLLTADLSRFNVITMYLLPDVNLLLRSKLRSLPAGTRIVSHDWDMGNWLPERTVEVVAPDKRVGLHKVSRLMRWTV
ncbi:MAG: methyltransferase domain-containing protein [Burkholderiales bacterium]|nr:methyltransferase domain-containing protein [Burkholderiales bacterium]